MATRKKILIVDDSSMTRSLVVSALEELKGVETVEAENGFQALKALPQHPFAMIITDINMPQIDGLEVLRFMKNHDAYKNIRSIIISTDRGEEDVKRGLALGADRYFIKPFDMDKLKETVQQLLKVKE